MRESLVEWRKPVVLMLARVVSVVAAIPVVVGLLMGAKGLFPVLPPLLAGMATAAWAWRSRTLSLTARGWLTMVPMAVAAAVGIYQLGTSPGPVLTLAIITVEVGLIDGVRAGVAALVVTTAIFVIAGIAGRETAGPRSVEQMALAATWLRMTMAYFICAGILLAFVSMAVWKIETALAERMHSEQDLQRAYQQLGQLTRHLEAVKEDERRHIARELHDELGQSLTLVKLNLKLAGQAPTPDETNRRLDETVAVVDRAIRSTRELSHGMRPPLLDEVGLVPALQAFVDEQSRLSGLKFELHVPAAAEGRLSTELETAAFRIVQETVTNIMRHAEARTIGITLEGGATELRLAIRDDGRGFEPAKVLGEVGPGGHMGLVGMRERARALDGSFEIRSTPAQGTLVLVNLPMAASA